MKKLLSAVYSVVAYVLFLGAFLYLIAFSMNIGPSLINGPASLPPLAAGAIDLGLITMFGLQHSIMARPGFKSWWTRIVPQHLERSTYVLISAGLVALVPAAWQPIEGTLWMVSGAGMIALHTLALLGFLMVPLCSFLTDHFELFGLRQAAEHVFGWQQSKPEFKQRSLYKRVRHPMMVGFLVAFWAVPFMTVGHLLFTVTMSAYILVGIHFEERDLARKHGQAYRDYQARVPKLIPIPSAQGAALATGTEATRSN
ncbi:MAG: isoprenylcysteine carboxylmethyltransferase family protein [Acidobacteriia bacterium]|nr:isoprenylcysteine carboxylmethyltransferase family protein [Terriglobia bacterium]